MRGEVVEFQGKTYSYIISLLDAFSQFHWLYSLQTKHSPGVKEYKKRCMTSMVYREHSSQKKEKNLKERSKDCVRKRKLKWYKAGHTTREHKKGWTFAPYLEKERSFWYINSKAHWYQLGLKLTKLYGMCEQWKTRGARVAVSLRNLLCSKKQWTCKVWYSWA